MDLLNIRLVVAMVIFVCASALQPRWVGECDEKIAR